MNTGQEIGYQSVLAIGGVSLSIKVFNLVVGLITGAILARLLGANGYGVYTFVFVLVQTVGLTLHSGIRTLAIREIATYKQNKKIEFLNGIVRWIRMVSGLATLFLLTMAIFLVWIFSGRMSMSVLLTLMVALCLIPAITFNSLQGAILRGFGKTLLGQFPQLVIRPGVFLLIILATWSYYGENIVTPESSMLLHFFAGIVSLVIVSIWCRNKIQVSVIGTQPKYKNQEWLRSLIPLTLVGAIHLLYSHTDIIILAIFTTFEDVGIYRIAVLTSSLVTFGLLAVRPVLAPKIAELFSIDEFAKLQRILTIGAQISVGIAILVFTAIIIGSEPLLEMMVGEEFLRGMPALIILCLGHLSAAVVGLSLNVLYMTRFERPALYCVSAGAIANIALDLLFIPTWGIIGAAVATTTSMILVSFLTYNMVKRHLNLFSLPIHSAHSVMKTITRDT